MGNLHTSTLAIVLLLAGSGSSFSATWAPLAGSSQTHTAELSSTASFSIPVGIATRGGVLHVTLVGGGEGGHAAKSACNAYAVQGGKGGDGGEVVEFDVNVLPGQCGGALVGTVGGAGRGALRGGNGSTLGESGGSTSLSCVGSVFATALGGGRRVDAVSAPRSAKGGPGGAVMNMLEQTGAAALEQRVVSVSVGGEGQTGRGGYGSGGGGGGSSVQQAGAVVRPDGTVLRQTFVRNAPGGKAGYGAGAGAGPSDYSAEATAVVAENAAQYGAGGGGGAAQCGGASGAALDAGSGYGGLVRIQWVN